MRSTLVLALLPAAFAVDMGDPNCPCTGDISLIPDGQQNKEIGYGTDCRPWDIAMSYCKDKEDGKGGWNTGDDGSTYDWCGQDWCYVDRDNCGDVTLDNGEKASGNVQQSVIYPLIELYYSYNTCGTEDLFSNSGTVWVWDFGECQVRTANDYYLLVDGSKSVFNDWDAVKNTMLTVMQSGLNVGLNDQKVCEDASKCDRVAMVEFSGKRAFGVADTVEIYGFGDTRVQAEGKVNSMTNLEGQTWTMMGLQKTIESWNQQSDINSEDRQRILCLITDGRPKPRTTASDADGDTAEPGCITTMINDQLPACENGGSPTDVGDNACRNLYCGDVNMDTTDCCPGDQNPCTSDEKDSLLQALRDGDILVAVIAVGSDAENIRSAPRDCNPPNCTPGGRDPCNCQYDIYYFDCLLKPGYDQNADAIPHRITTISNFNSFFQYQDPTASTPGGTDGQICIDPKLLLPPSPPTNACTEIPEPKDVVLVLDSSKSMYTKKGREAGKTAKEHWLSVMQDLQDVICLYNSQAQVTTHRCAFTVRDHVGLVRFATNAKVEFNFNLPQLWWSNVRFVVNGEPGYNRKELKYMTDTVEGLWLAFDMMEKMDPDVINLQDGETKAKRREIILITDGRPHCKRDLDGTECRPCAPAYKQETLLREGLADAELKIVWKGDRTTHDGTIAVDKDELAQDEWFGCLNIDFDDTDQFVVIESFDEDVFRAALLGDTVCVQQNRGDN